MYLRLPCITLSLEAACVDGSLIRKALPKPSAKRRTPTNRRLRISFLLRGPRSIVTGPEDHKGGPDCRRLTPADRNTLRPGQCAGRIGGSPFRIKTEDEIPRGLVTG